MKKALKEEICPRFLEWVDPAALDRLDETLMRTRTVGEHVRIDGFGDGNGEELLPLSIGDLRDLASMLLAVSSELESEGLGARNREQRKRLGRGVNCDA